MRKFPSLALLAQPLTTQEGSITAPLIFIIVVVSCAYLGFLGLRLYWTKTILTQYRLDRCVQKTSHDILDDIQSIESSHARMRIERGIIQAGMALPTPVTQAAARVSRGVLAAENLYRQARLVNWKLRQASWIAKRGCDFQSDRFFPLSSHPWIEEPPDLFGPTVWELNPVHKNTFYVKLWSSPRYSAAKIFIKNKGAQNVSTRSQWHAEWTAWSGIF